MEFTNVRGEGHFAEDVIDRPTSETCPRFLLVDDDPVFCKAVRRVAKRLTLDLTVCKTWREVSSLPDYRLFDVAILDYFLGEANGFSLSQRFGRQVPVVLVSNTEAVKISGGDWTDSIQTFVPKSLGIEVILAEAMLTALGFYLE